MNLLRNVVWTAASLLGCAMAQATPTIVESGMVATTYIMDCRYATISYANGQCIGLRVPGTVFAVRGTNTHDATSASSAAVDLNRGSTTGAANMNASTYLPSLHGYASSNPGYTPSLGNVDPAKFTGDWSSLLFAEVWGVQGYQYNGETPFELTVTATMDASFSDPGGYSMPTFASTVFGIFRDPNYRFTYTGHDYCNLYGATSPGCAGAPSADAVGEVDLTGSGAESSTIRYVINPGERFYVGAFLQTITCCGVTVDASHSFNMVFNDPSQLSSFAVAGVTANAVPEPATLLLMLSGLALLGRQARRHPPSARLL